MAIRRLGWRAAPPRRGRFVSLSLANWVSLRPTRYRDVVVAVDQSDPGPVRAPVPVARRGRCRRARGDLPGVLERQHQTRLHRSGHSSQRRSATQECTSAPEQGTPWRRRAESNRRAGLCRGKSGVRKSSLQDRSAGQTPREFQGIRSGPRGAAVCTRYESALA